MKHCPELTDILVSGLEEMGLTLSQAKLETISTFFNLLLIQNETMNLISAKQSLETQVAVHLLDSLTPLLLSQLPQSEIIMDFGSGGGLPGIPLSIVWDYRRFDMIEATGKKVRFLSSVIEQLGLDKVGVINQYLEPNKNENSQYYDLICTRAVSALKNVADIAGPRLAEGGYFLAFKGPQADVELKEARTALKKHNLSPVERLDFTLPLAEVNRCLLLFQKR